MNRKILTLFLIIIFIFSLFSLSSCSFDLFNEDGQSNDYQYSNNSGIVNSKTFKILASAENKDLESILLDYAKQNGYEFNIDYSGTLEIMGKLNDSSKYDAIWVANSIWTYINKPLIS